MTAIAGADTSRWLAAIVDSSFDAILSKTLDGVITSWNAGAERLFGYAAQEAIGQPITMIIPTDRLHEEVDIIARLRRGERIDRLETVRRAKNGDLLEVELTISPVYGTEGRILGASKIARDIGERRRSAAAEQLVLREMHHRIKNLLSIVQGLISVSFRSARTMEGFVQDLIGRVSALAAAHDLILVEPRAINIDTGEGTTLPDLLQAVLAPYLEDGPRIALSAPREPLGRRALTSVALIFHELATNAVKYGGLSSPAGRLSIEGEREGAVLKIFWREYHGQEPDGTRQSFGTELLRATLKALGAGMEQSWDNGVLTFTLVFDRETLKH